MYEMIQPIMWEVAAVAAAAICVMWFRNSKRPAAERSGFPHGRALIGLALFAALIVPSVGFVPAGHRGTVYEWGGGVSPSERGEGITFLVPWIQRMTLMNVRTRKVFSSKVFAQSLDLQEITVVASVNYHIDPARAAELFQSVGPEYRETVIQPALFQVTKTAVGRVKAEDFALSRAPLAEVVRTKLGEQLALYGIVVEYVNIEDAIFDPEFIKAVKEKVVAEQEAAEQQNLVAAKRALKEQTIINAEAKARAIQIEATAQAEANRRINRSLTGILLRWKWLVTWNGALPTTLVGGETGVLLGVGAGGAASSYYP